VQLARQLVQAPEHRVHAVELGCVCAVPIEHEVDAKMCGATHWEHYTYTPSAS
jgi:hypothetical protein